jgi:hypothetical protein
LPLQRSRWGRFTRRRALPARLRSAFRDSHPLDGLHPPLPLRPCFMPLAFLGFRPSELFPPNEAVAPLDARSPHAVVDTSRNTRSPLPVDSLAAREVGMTYRGRRDERAGPVDRLQGLAPRRSPWPEGRCYPLRRFDALLGFRLFRALRAPGLVGRFRSTSSHELDRLDLAPPRRALPRLGADSTESQSTRLRARWLSPPNLPS